MVVVVEGETAQSTTDLGMDLLKSVMMQ
jgi:hypothetical protein